MSPPGKQNTSDARPEVGCGQSGPTWLEVLHSAGDLAKCLAVAGGAFEFEHVAGAVEGSAVFVVAGDGQEVAAAPLADGAGLAAGEGGGLVGGDEGVEVEVR